MHSCIFQVSTKPISEGDYVSPEYFYDNSGDFADYIGDPITGKHRLDSIKYVFELFGNMFTINKDVITFNGLGNFVRKWNDYMRELSSNLDDNEYKQYDMWRIGCATKETHLYICSRFFIEDWNECAGPAEDLIDFLQHRAKPGDKLYIGAVIDYHF